MVWTNFDEVAHNDRWDSTEIEMFWFENERDNHARIEAIEANSVFRDDCTWCVRCRQ